MSYSQVEEQEQQRRKRVLVDQAIAFAMQSRWEDAVRANQSVLEIGPRDVDALNRLGRSLTELGRYREARESYSQAVKLDPLNTIAQRNLARLSTLKADVEPKPTSERVDPRLFTTETGKSSTTTLVRTASRELIARMAVGDQVKLVVQGRLLQVVNSRREVLGRVEPRLAQRLITLIDGGNRYVAALISLDEPVRVLISEVYQHPSQVGRIAFPTKGDSTGVRANIRGSLVRTAADDEDDEEESYNLDDADGAAEPELGADEAEERAPIVDSDDEHVGT
jgi:tetratricopeptide (TPR) repeat protein